MQLHSKKGKAAKLQALKFVLVAISVLSCLLVLALQRDTPAKTKSCTDGRGICEFKEEGANGLHGMQIKSMSRRFRRDADEKDTEVKKNPIIKQTIALLEEGNRIMETSNHDDVILVIGNTGAGKSTATLFLTGDNSKLEAYWADPDTILIRDHFHKISRSTIVSKTIFPEIMIEPETDTAFYDCPGFSDTRNSTVEIVNSVFTKKIADKAKRVKILLVVNHYSLKAGRDRKDFILLVKHAADFLKNMDIFRPAVALLATKVESRFPDFRVLGGMAKFLDSARKVLDQVMDGETLKSADKLLETLLEKNEDGDYTRLTFFRQPDDEGLLSEIEEVQERKIHMKQVIWNNIQYVTKTIDDFGFPLSEKAKNDVRALTDAINDRIFLYFDKLGKQLTSLYEGELNTKSDDFNLQTLTISLEKLFRLFGYLRNLDTTLAEGDSESVFLANVVNNLTLYTDNSKEILDGISNNGEYLRFISGFSTAPPPTADFIGPHSLRSTNIVRWLEPLNNFMRTIESRLYSFYTDIDRQITGLINTASVELKEYYHQSILQWKNLETAQFEVELKRLLSSLSQIEAFCKEDTNTNSTKGLASISKFVNTTQSDFMHQFLALVNPLNTSHILPLPSLSVSILQIQTQAKLIDAAKFLDFFKESQDKGTDILESGNELEDSLDNDDIGSGLHSSVAPKATELLALAKSHDHDPSRWLPKLRQFVFHVKENFTNIEDIIHNRIIEATKDMSKSLTSYYASNFESFDHVEDLKERFQSDVNWFKKTMYGIDPDPEMDPSIMTHSKLVRNTIKDYLSPRNMKGTFNESINQLSQEGSFIDILQSYSSHPIKPRLLTWFKPLKLFYEELDEIVNEKTTCGYNPGYRHEYDTMNNKNVFIAKGTFVSLNEVLKSCFLNQLTNSKNGPETKTYLLIMSKHTVYIDTKIDSAHNTIFSDLTLVIISPNWVVRKGFNSINLNGQPGKPPNPLKASQRSNGVGEIGVPGLPGGNAGHFLGIGKNVAGEKLHVSTNGGMGGKGQEGGNGRHGANGKKVTLNEIKYTVESERKFLDGRWKVQINIDRQNPYTYNALDYSCTGSSSDPTGSNTYIHACRDFKFTGTKGVDGQEGGHGGRGGRGGHFGLPNIFGPSEFRNSFISSNKHGADGADGNGGTRGVGGDHGSAATVRINPTRGRGTNALTTIQSFQPWGTKAADGRHGEKGKNIANQKHPPLPDYDVSYPIQSSFVNMFRNYARNNSGNPFHHYSLKTFIQSLDDNEKLRQSQVTPIVSYINEFYDLETHHFWHQGEMNFQPFYKQFLTKLSKIIAQPETTYFTGADLESLVKVMKYLHAATYGRIHSFDPKYDTNLITDMVTYLDLTIEELKSLAQKSHSLSALKLITKVKQDYNHQIQEKFKEASNFIAMEVVPEIKRIQDQLDENVKQLLQEIEELKKQVQEEREKLQANQQILENEIGELSNQAVEEKKRIEKRLDEKQKLLEKKRRQLKTQMMIKKIFQVLNVGAFFLNMMGPYGKAAAAGIGMATSIGEKVLGATNTGQVTQEQVDALQNNVNNQFLSINVDQLSKFHVLLDDTNKKLLNDPMQFKDINILINRLKIETDTEIKRIKFESEDNKFPSSEKQSNSFIQSRKTQLQNELKSLHQIIINTENSTESKNQTETELEKTNKIREERLEKVETILKHLDMSLDIYSQVRGAESQLNEVAAALKEAQNQIEQLDKFANKIDNEMTSMLDNSRENLNIIQNILASENKTGSALDVTRWQTVTKLRDMKNLIQKQFTQGFEIEEEMARGFEKLEEAFTTLIQLYDRMDHFQEQSKLANFIADINSVQFQNAKILDPKLSEKIAFLERVILSTAVLGQYELILNSLKMGAFPFADYYLGSLDIPVSLTRPSVSQHQFQNPTGTEVSLPTEEPTPVNLALKASTLIQHIRSKVITMKSTHKELDDYLFFSDFYSSSSTNPFYVWKDKDSDLVQNLLEGNTIAVKADIVESPLHYDAIKFSNVELKFRFVPKKEQGNLDVNASIEATTQLDNELENFKVNMTHLGNSFFRYDDKFYLVTSNKLTFIHSFKKKPSGEAVLRNSAYKKISDGDILLSPYTVWQIQLEPMQPQTNFTQLNNLVQKGASMFDLQLELIGSGSYVKKGLSQELKVDKYYKNDKFTEK